MKPPTLRNSSDMRVYNLNCACMVRAITPNIIRIGLGSGLTEGLGLGFSLPSITSRSGMSSLDSSFPSFVENVSKSVVEYAMSSFN